MSSFFIINGLLWKIQKAREGKPSSMSSRLHLTPLIVFEALFGNNFEWIRKETELYAQRHGNSDFSLSLVEIKCAVGILIFSGYHRFPSRKNYWEQQADMLNNIVSENMRTDRFENILQFLHVADSNNLTKCNSRTYVKVP